MAKEKETQENKKNTNNKLFLIGIPLMVLLIVGGGLAAYFFGGFNGFRSAEAGSTTENPKNNEQLGPLLKMEDFIVNIMHKDSTRFLRLGITLEAKDDESSKRINNRMPQITDGVLLMVGNKQFDQIKDLQGKLQLKADLLVHLNTLLGNNDVNDIFFTDFVVQ